MALPFAEDLPYWRTGASPPDTWLRKATTVLERYGGVVSSSGFMRERGRGGFLLAFELGGERFKVVWPVCPSESEDVAAAERQAATTLYHHVKAAAVAAAVIGSRNALMPFLLLPDGRTMGSIATPELAQAVPKLLSAPGERSG